MKGFYKYFFLPLFVIFTVIPVHAFDAGENIGITIYTYVKNVSIGDSLSLYCEVRTPNQYETSEPLPEREPTDYEIQGQPQRIDASEAAPEAETYRFFLYAFSPDTLAVGPFAAEYVNADGTRKRLLSNVLHIPVEGFVESAESVPLPNRNPLTIQSTGIPLLIILIVALIAILCAAAFIYYLRKKRTSVPVIDEPVDEIGEFLRLKERKLFESGDLKELYVQVSLKMRAFLNRNLHFDALNDTTGEIVRELTETYDNFQVAKIIKQILEESDNVKYAKYVPPLELSTTVIDRAIESVKTILDEIERRERAEAASADNEFGEQNRNKETESNVHAPAGPDGKDE